MQTVEKMSTMGRTFYLLLAVATLTSAAIPASAIVNSVDASRQRRSLKVAAKIPLIKKIPGLAKAHIAKIPVIGSLLGFQANPEIPHLGTYPIWKVHRYHGISLQPVPYPRETIPSPLPLPPNLSGEAPSIVNVPDPNYAPPEVLAIPASEYGAPGGAPEPAPYHAPPAPAGPYPPVSPRDPRGPVYPAEVSTTAFASSGNIVGETDLSSLQSLLPPELFNKVQLYASTPGGQERVNALLGIANNAKKLKFNAAQSIQGMFQKLFGGAGGSTNVALNSGTWTDVPDVYPATQGIFNSFRAVGTGISGSLLPTLPEVPALPKIPGLHALPPTPQLPHINLPDITPLSATGLGGRYVSIQFPHSSPVAHSVPEESYSPPAPVYSPPQQYSPPAQQYGPPAQQYSPPAQQYGPPNPPAQQYSIPEIPATSYGTPVGPVFSYPQSSGSSTSSFFQAPQQTYGTPDASFAASENQEQFESRERELQQESEASDTSVPLKTTKLQRVSESRPLRSEALRAYLDAQRGFKPSHQDQNKQTDNEIDEDGQD